MLLIGLAQGHAKAFRMENAHNPCASATNAKGPRFFTPAEDGLRQDWSKEVVFMNPPYGRVIGLWVRKAFESAQAGAVVVCLLPARTDTRWWHDYVMRGEFRFIRGRLRFGDGKNSAPFPSAIVIFRAAVGTFPMTAQA